MRIVSPSMTVGDDTASAARMMASLIIAALASSGVGRACGERAGGGLLRALLQTGDGGSIDAIRAGDQRQAPHRIDPKTHQQGCLHGTLSGVAAEGPSPMTLYWLVYRHNNHISVVIEPGASPIHARLRASIAGLDQGEFTEGHE